MAPGHAGAGIAHDGFDGIFLRGPEAMDGADAARWFFFFERTAVDVAVGVVQGIRTVGAEVILSMMHVATVHMDHHKDDLLFAFQSSNMLGFLHVRPPLSSL